MAIKRKLEELERTEKKLEELRDRKKLLEGSIKREEDEEIVRALRSLSLGHDELIKVLDGIRAGNLKAEDLKAGLGEPDGLAQPGDEASAQTDLPVPRTEAVEDYSEEGSYDYDETERFHDYE